MLNLHMHSVDTLKLYYYSTSSNKYYYAVNKYMSISFETILNSWWQKQINSNNQQLYINNAFSYNLVDNSKKFCIKQSRTEKLLTKSSNDT